MTDTPKKLVVDIAANTQTYIDLTPEEIEQREVDAQAAAIEQAERSAIEENREALKASARAKLVAGTPLTEEEAATLVV